MIKLSDSQGNKIEDRREILKIAETFYSALYESKLDNQEARRENKDKKSEFVMQECYFIDAYPKGQYDKTGTPRQS